MYAGNKNLFFCLFHLFKNLTFSTCFNSSNSSPSYVHRVWLLPPLDDLLCSFDKCTDDLEVGSPHAVKGDTRDEDLLARERDELDFLAGMA